MKETNITTKDFDIEVVFGPYNKSREPRPDVYGVANFDKNGKLVHGNLFCDLIYADDGHYFFRICQDKGDDEG